MVGAQLRPDGAGNDIARRKFRSRDTGHEALAIFIDKDRAFTAHRFADEAELRAGCVQRGRMELHEFHITQRCAGAGGDGEALTPGNRRDSCHVRKPADAAGRDHHPTRAKENAATRAFGHQPRNRAVFDTQAGRLQSLRGS